MFTDRRLMDAQQQLFGLMAVAEEHQKAVKTAIDGLSAERAALAQERAAVAQAAASVAGVAGEVRKAAADAVSAMQRAAGEAAGASVRQSLAGASEAAEKALGEAAKPVIGSLSGVVQAASDAEGSMRNAGAWFAWKWVAVAAGGLVGVCRAGVAVAPGQPLARGEGRAGRRCGANASPRRGLGKEGRTHRHDHLRRAAVHRGQQPPS